MGIKYTVEYIEESKGEKDTWRVVHEDGSGCFLVHSVEGGEALIAALDGADLNEKRTQEEEEELLLKLADAAPVAAAKMDGELHLLAELAQRIALNRLFAGLAGIMSGGIIVSELDEDDEEDEQPSDQVNFAAAGAD